MPDESVVFVQDGSWLNDAGHLITSIYVDARHASERARVTKLVKLCETQYAPEILGTIRATKPDLFRDDDDTLISDPDEAQVSRVTAYTERIDDPDDLAKAEIRDNESNRAAELAGSAMRRTTGTKRTEKNTTTHTFGKNCWIFCTAIAPTDEEAETKLWEAMDPKYDHSTDIHQPRAFAFALSSMVAEQLGPQGGEMTKQTRLGEFSSNSHHRTQTVFHGPVLYVDDPFEFVERARNDYETMFIPIFLKRRKYEAQREYRFVIWCDEEPTMPFVDLEVSPAMFSSFQSPPSEEGMTEKASNVDEGKRRDEARTGPQKGDAERKPQPLAAVSEDPNGLPSMFDLPSESAMPVGIFKGVGGNAPLEEGELKHQAVRALRIAVERIPDKRLVDAASAAFHAEPLVIRLCEEFLDPIRSVTISDDNFVIIRINAADSWRSRSKFVVGPHGEVAYHVKREGFESGGHGVVRHEFPLSGSMVEELSKLGLPKRSS